MPVNNTHYSLHGRGPAAASPEDGAKSEGWVLPLCLVIPAFLGAAMGRLGKVKPLAWGGSGDGRLLFSDPALGLEKGRWSKVSLHFSAFCRDLVWRDATRGPLASIQKNLPNPFWSGGAGHEDKPRPDTHRSSHFCCRLIALEMAKIHAIHANGSLPMPTLWHKMHRYFTLVKEEITPRYRDLGGLRVAKVSAPPPTLASRQLLEDFQGCRSQGGGVSPGHLPS